MSKMSVTLYTTKPDDGQNLSAEIKEAADAALQHVSERLKGLPIDPEVFIGRAPTAHGCELVVVRLPLTLPSASRVVLPLLCMVPPSLPVADMLPSWPALPSALR